MSRKSAIPIALTLLCGLALSASSAEETFSRSVIVFSPDSADGRLAATREAIAFWNETLADLRVRTRLADPEVAIASPYSQSLGCLPG
jgi:hypothetical protein